MAETSPSTFQDKREPSILVRVIWFIFLGSWLSGLVVLIAWAANVTIIGLPLGLWLLNRVPQFATLKATPQELVIDIDEATGVQTTTLKERDQRPFWTRALYFLLVGWWFSGLWLATAWLLCIIIVGLPIGFWMFGAAGAVTTLKR